MLLLHHGTPGDQRARSELAKCLPDATVSEPDELGVFEVTVEAGDFDQALDKVWSAVGSSGCDDHIVFLEHPDLPGHWRHVASAPAA